MTVHDLPVPPLPGASRKDAAAVLAENRAATLEERAPHVLVARYRKARAIAKHILGLGATAEVATQLGQYELGRQLAAQAADVNVPSETTWALVVELVREVRP